VEKMGRVMKTKGVQGSQGKGRRERIREGVKER